MGIGCKILKFLRENKYLYRLLRKYRGRVRVVLIKHAMEGKCGRIAIGASELCMR